jgi:hypothetical protein
MRKINFILLTGLLCFYTNANAWFFFFIPGSVTRGVTDAITGAKGNLCVRDSAKVGDVIPSLAGNTMKILSLSGTSTICSNPALPIRAEVEFTFTLRSNAGVNLSDDYEAKPLTDLQRYNGTILLASSKSSRNKGVVITTREKKANADPQMLASGIEKTQISNLAEGMSKNAEQMKINGSNAWRFEVHGKTKGVFGTEMVYIITILEGDNEILVLNTYTSLSNYEKDRDELRKIALDINGVTTNATAASTPATNPQPKASEIQQNTTAPPTEVTNASQIGNKLRELSKMLSEGLITQQDYETKKVELLKNL